MILYFLKLWTYTLHLCYWAPVKVSYGPLINNPPAWDFEKKLMPSEKKKVRSIVSDEAPLQILQSPVWVCKSIFSSWHIQHRIAHTHDWDGDATHGTAGSSGVIGSLSTGWRLWKQRKVPKQSNNSVWHLYKKHHTIHKTEFECSHHGKEPPASLSDFPFFFPALEKKTETQWRDYSEEACTQELQPVVTITSPYLETSIVSSSPAFPQSPPPCCPLKTQMEQSLGCLTIHDHRVEACYVQEACKSNFLNRTDIYHYQSYLMC